MIKLLYKPMGMLVSVLGGIVAGAIFKRRWIASAAQRSTRRALFGDVPAE
jgi:hypothetical protein